MFKQITNFENFNIFVGDKNDLKIKKIIKKTEINDLIIEYQNDNIDEDTSEIFFLNILDNVNQKDVYVISKSKKEFMDFWLKGMIRYLN